MGIISGGEKIPISPSWSEHGQQKVDKPQGRHRGASVTSIEDTVPQQGKGKKLPKKSIFSRGVSSPEKAAAKQAKATEKKAVKEFVAALDDVKKAANRKDSTRESVLKVVSQHAKNPDELEDLLANLARKSGKAAAKPHVQQAFREAGVSMMVLNARYEAHQPLKHASDNGLSFREGLDKSMDQLRALRKELNFATFPDSIRDQLKSYPALAECLVSELPNSRGFSPSGSHYPSTQAHTILTCQCFEQARQIKKDVGKALDNPQLPPETRGKLESTMKEVQEILEATPEDLRSLELSYAIKGEGSFLSPEYTQDIDRRSHMEPVRRGSFSREQISSRRESLSQSRPVREETVQSEATQAPKKPSGPPRRAAPAIPYQASLAALKKEKSELTAEADSLQGYLNDLLTYSKSSDLVNLLGKEFSAHKDTGWSFGDYASMCQHAAEAIVSNPSLTPSEAIDVAYGKMGTSHS
ncbi:hypothetical protein [Endozoicomonas arenosclerae]|uniref:hypothetical protein n=1 Tax=Endozoicomonas arenosclerae TaxID=1633495 RepID=UPI00078092A0|nr:hypothetical protein [Endozoicomonas arenosclerae]